MIVVPEADGWIVVTQADHARLGAEMLRLFRAPELAAYPRRNALLEAIAAHDDGWWEADAAPTLARSGDGPADFRSLPPARRREIWLRSVERHVERSPYVAAMAAGHLLRLLATWGGGEWQELRAELAARREEIVTEGRLDPDSLADDDAWLRIADDLSLAAATGDVAFLAHGPFRAEVAAREEVTELFLEPFPLAGATRFELPIRRLARRRYRDGVELGVALATATWERRAIRLAPR